MQQDKIGNAVREEAFKRQRARMWHDITEHARPTIERINSISEFRKTLGHIKYEEPNVCSFTVTKDCFPNAIFLTVTEKYDCLRVERQLFKDVPDTQGRSETENIDLINVDGDLGFRTRDGKEMNLTDTLEYLFLPVIQAA